MALTDTMEKIKKVRPLAEEEVLEQPRETYTGRFSRHRKAKDDLKKLMEQYRVELLQSAVFILVTGSGRDEFMKLATETMGFFQADPNQFYSDIVKQVSPQLYTGKESNPGLLDVVSRILENKALDVGITGYPMVTFRQEFRRKISNQTDFQALVKEIISKQVGTEVVGAQAVKSILNEALKTEHSGKTTPILLSLENVDSELVAGLRRISRRVGVITAEQGQTDEQSVLMAMADLKSQLGDANLATAKVRATEEKQTSLEKAVEQNLNNFGPGELLLPDGITREQAVEAIAELKEATTLTPSELKDVVEVPQVSRRTRNQNKNKNSQGEK